MKKKTVFFCWAECLKSMKLITNEFPRIPPGSGVSRKGLLNVTKPILFLFVKVFDSFHGAVLITKMGVWVNVDITTRSYFVIVFKAYNLLKVMLNHFLVFTSTFPILQNLFTFFSLIT